MPIDAQTLETLEFPKIRAQLARYTAFSASKELALTLQPQDDAGEVLRRLQLTSEARRFLDEHPDASIGGARDIRGAVQHAARGGMLEPATLLDIATTLTSMCRLRTTLLKLNPEIAPLLTDYASTLPHEAALTLEEAITRVIDDDGNVRDRATPALQRIRNRIHQAVTRLKEHLNRLITSSKFSSALQEPIITVRNGRYVVPVRVEQRRIIAGLVHDQSASGATLYVEPLTVVDLNNEWHEQQLAEQQEIERILTELSERIGSHAVVLVAGVDTLALLDLAFAQAHYALALRCIAPAMTTPPPCTGATPPGEHSAALPDPTTVTEAPLLLRGARHPLLDQQMVVPLDVWLGHDFCLLLMTGPNTGGKTVALKTVGLLVLMAQAGLHIPAAHPARLPIFQHIFADIGDEQSIEQSLSTFSSHMTTIIRILDVIEEHAASHHGTAPHTLVLLDELGAGTDPVEGAALARAILSRLLERGCLGIFTTHYAELKAFAYNTPGVQNASVEFDIETLAPTYRLMIGLPGRSNALAIATRLGMDAALVEHARSTITHEAVQIEDLLADIHREREAAAAALQRSREVQEDAEKYRERLANELDDLEATREERIEAAYQQAEEELRDVRTEIARLRNDMRSLAHSRQEAQHTEERLQAAEAAVRQRKNEAVRKQRSERAAQHAPHQQEPRPLQVGDTVHVRSVGLSGEILTIDEEEQSADVQVGGFRMHVPLRELRRDKAPKQQEHASAAVASSAPSLPSVPDVSMNLDMRGSRAAEVSPRLDRYLNDAYLAGLSQVHLIHGKGSGVLRQVVRDVLRKHPLVASFDSGGREHDDGMTVARLVER